MNVLQLAETRRLYARLLAQVWPYRWQFGIAVVGMVLTAATEPALPALLKPMLDQSFVRNMLNDRDDLHHLTPWQLQAGSHRTS